MYIILINNETEIYLQNLKFTNFYILANSLTLCGRVQSFGVSNHNLNDKMWTQVDLIISTRD